MSLMYNFLIENAELALSINAENLVWLLGGNNSAFSVASALIN